MCPQLRCAFLGRPQSHLWMFTPHALQPLPYRNKELFQQRGEADISCHGAHCLEGAGPREPRSPRAGTPKGGSRRPRTNRAGRVQGTPETHLPSFPELSPKFPPKHCKKKSARPSKQPEAPAPLPTAGGHPGQASGSHEPGASPQGVF